MSFCCMKCGGLVSRVDVRWFIFRVVSRTAHNSTRNAGMYVISIIITSSCVHVHHQPKNPVRLFTDPPLCKYSNACTRITCGSDFSSVLINYAFTQQTCSIHSQMLMWVTAVQSERVTHMRSCTHARSQIKERTRMTDWRTIREQS